MATFVLLSRRYHCFSYNGNTCVCNYGAGRNFDCYYIDSCSKTRGTSLPAVTLYSSRHALDAFATSQTATCYGQEIQETPKHSFCGVRTTRRANVETESQEGSEERVRAVRGGDALDAGSRPSQLRKTKTTDTWSCAHLPYSLAGWPQQQPPRSAYVRACD